GVVFGLVLGICLYATVFVLPVYLQNVRQFTANQTGLVILPGALASAFTMASMGRLTGKFDGRLSIAAGVAVFALSMWKHANFTPYAEATRERLAAITQALINRGELPALAQTKAIGFLNGIVTRQAMVLSFEQLFLLFGTIFVLSLPLLLLMHRSKGMPGSG